MLQDYYQKASRLKKLFIKAGILYALILVTFYAVFRAYYINLTPSLLIFSILLYIAEMHTVILMYGFLYSLWPRKYRSYNRINNNKNLQINMFVTVCGEPLDVVKETISHAKRAAEKYIREVNPKEKPRVIVLNDGKAAKKEGWQDVADYCEDAGVEHVERETNEGFKAGNINNGLKVYPADDPHNTIDCFFDADFCAKEEFLLEILKPLADDSVDFVQSPQRYKNMNTWVAQGAGAHQIFFFDYVCPAKAYDNALFLCGTNYAIRREALLQAGGVDNRFVTEDYATSIKLHLMGKRGVFISKVLALGMAPMNLKEYFNQQTRWCKGCLDANGKYLKELLFGPLNWKQKFHYFLSTVYYFIGVRDLILILAPIPYLFWGVSLIRANTIQYLAFIYLPLMIFNFSLFFVTFQNPIKSLVLDVVSFPVFAKAFLASVIGKNLPFSVTIKKYEKENPFKVYRNQLIVALVLISGLIFSTITKSNYNIHGHLINYFWATYDALFLSIGFILVVRENYNISFIESKVMAIYRNVLFTLNLSKRIAFNPAVLGFGAMLIVLFVGRGVIDGTLAYENTVEKVLPQKTNTELLVPGGGIYYGYYLPELDTHPNDPKINVIDGEQPTMVMYYQDWNQNSNFNAKFMQKLWDKNVIPIITWEPWDAQQNSVAPINQNGYPQKLIPEGYYDSYIREYAKSAKKWNKPFFLRFAHEMNGNWYPWGNIEKESAQNYIKMWKHVHNIFNEEGADNVIWVWSPNNTDMYGETEGVLDFYPGYDYVDWVGFSSFNWGTANEWNQWMDFKSASWKVYSKFLTLNKPIMVSETSSVSQGGDKNNWFWQTLNKDIPSMPMIRAVIIFNDDFNKADFSLSSGMDEVSIIKNYLIDNGYYLKKLLLSEY
ncbi:MAG: Family 2 glycosyl transferase [Microgenomates group bacterium GW2011_GWC1_37_8]|uniref:Family 2 glycosyl transferase n=1 Tax=Candidatus Woesebacteria bacterium GW2011_GWB1_38_8 TaxID=1618570 RepID=A0A0G0P7I3_9BACT|nr:MAG: Family 2 glycosyl transferase [Microgenomates group bacterium GW2011_GWC1_37_8]KKQ85261.1 MAG: Family 2 glycosyl transferase [Candidatus Woesebacteria bacterium GW2011_GWB1_38_8]